MYKLYFLLFLLPLTVFASAKESCYTVQLLSTNASQSELKRVSKQVYPANCKMMKISSTLTVRCGCYEKIKDARTDLKELKAKHKHAYIATTYKYRFASDAPSKSELQNIIPHTVTQKKASKESGLSDNELQLMLQSFLYVNDLENAYKTAKIGYKQNPNSYYWNKKMAEISMWSGRTGESMKYFEFMNRHHYDPKLQKKIIDHGLASYQYEEVVPLIEDKTRRDPSQENINEMLFIQSQAGVPERSSLVLTQLIKLYPHNRLLPLKLLEIDLEMGDIQAAQKDVDRLEHSSMQLSSTEAEHLAYFYYLKHDLLKAYKALHRADKQNASSKFYEYLSDIGWYFKKYKTASDASLKLYEQHKTRDVDYERILYLQKDNNLTLASEVSIEAYEKFQNSYIFYAFAFHALSLKKYDALESAVETIEKKRLAIVNDAQYWLIKSELYKHNKQYAKEKEALQKALALSPDDINIQLNILYMQIEKSEGKNLEIVLNAIADNPNLSPSFYFPLASGYYNLQDINRAAYYLDLIKQENLSIQNSLEFMFLQAGIYQAKNNSDAYKSTLAEIKKELKKSKQNSPEIIKTAQYQKNYLNVLMESAAPDKFEKKLQEAKAYLSKDEYNTIAYSWALKNSANEKAHSLFYKMSKHELWMHFSNAIIEENHSKIEDLIRAYVKLKSWSDISTAAHDDGQIALAQTMAYEAHAHNDDSLGAYLQHLSMVQKRSDLLDVKPAHYIREALKQKYVKVKNRSYLFENWYLYSDLDFYRNESLDTKRLLSVPENSLRAGIGVQHNFERGFIQLDTHYHDAMASYISYQLLYEYRINHYFNVALALAKNIKSDESIPLLLAGKKDMIEAKLTYNILPSTTLSTRYDHYSYNSQDDIYLGTGDYIFMDLSYQIRNGYPDMRIGTFMDAGTYHEVAQEHGVIDEIQGVGLNVLPDNFYNIGMHFSYGMANSELYTRVWRPFVELSAFYNSFVANYNYGFNLGYGGKVFGKDHLVVGTSYSQSNSGTNDTIFELYLKYSILYTH